MQPRLSPPRNVAGLLYTGPTKARGRMSLRRLGLVCVSLFAGPLIALLSGCGAAAVTANSSNATFSLSPATVSIDTNCTGCNAVNARGSAVHKFAATLINGSPAAVNWSIAGGDAGAGAGKIDAEGRYTPPGYLTGDRAEVTVSARLASNPEVVASAQIEITPGFLQPLTPENAALGPDGSVTLTGRLAQAGGQARVQFSVANTASGTGAGLGTLSPPTCQHDRRSFTTCSVTYTAPAAIATTGVTYVVATAGGSRAETEILLNTAGVTSNPVAHQEQMATLMPLGSSGGNNNDLDARGGTIADCCSGTLGSLIQDATGRQYLLSNNHVLARSDQATVGDTIVQPGLIDNNCTPNGDGPGTLPVAALSAWLPLKSSQTNADAAIAQVGTRTLESSGAILELGTRQADGTLAAAPPGISSTGGRGEAAGLQMKVAKSGRTTGLTCAGVSAVDLDVSVDYFKDCAETRPYFTKVFTNQVAISGDRFSDAGDSGALVVDANDAEPVGLFFAGGIDESGVGQGVANPAQDVLSELSTQAGSGASYTFVGGADHAVSCLSYGDSAVSAAQALTLTEAETARGQQALYAARALLNPAAGILGVGLGKSSDHPGEAALIVYVDESATPTVPSIVGGVRTVVIATNAYAVASGTAPASNAATGAPALAAAALNRGVQVKQQRAHTLMPKGGAIFGVGVGQSLDNPRDVALVIYVDRNRLPAHLPQVVEGVRTRYVLMDRLHVTRSYAAKTPSTLHCMPKNGAAFDPDHLVSPLF